MLRTRPIAPRLAPVLALTALGLSPLHHTVAAKTIPIPATVSADTNVAYLGPDRKEKLDVFWPKAAKPGDKFPCLIIIHGGAMQGGDKAEGQYWQYAFNMVDSGIVGVPLNYFLSDFTGHAVPIAARDGKTAVRFLRKNAEKYHIDPDKIATMGLSAGGWMSSWISLTDQGSYYTPWVILDSDTSKDHPVQVPLMDQDASRLLYPEYASRPNAYLCDWNGSGLEYVSPDDPPLQVWVDNGGSRVADSLGKLGIYTESIYVGENSHAPDPDLTLINGELLWKLNVRYLRKVFEQSPRASAPEVWPLGGGFNDSVRVTFLPATTGSKLTYTLDGSEPTEASTLYNGPFALRQTATLKAKAFKAGMQASGTVQATFTKGGPVRPVITGPLGLPDAEVGKPYSVRFTAQSPKPPRWALVGGSSPPGWPNAWNRPQGPISPFGISLDQNSGLYSGTPKEAGTFLFAVEAGVDPSQELEGWKGGTDLRLYQLVVNPGSTGLARSRAGNHGMRLREAGNRVVVELGTGAMDARALRVYGPAGRLEARLSIPAGARSVVWERSAGSLPLAALKFRLER